MHQTTGEGAAFLANGETKKKVSIRINCGGSTKTQSSSSYSAQQQKVASSPKKKGTCATGRNKLPAQRHQNNTLSFPSQQTNGEGVNTFGDLGFRFKRAAWSMYQRDNHDLIKIDAGVMCVLNHVCEGASSVVPWNNISVGNCSKHL